jgi:hypothetical protein
MRIHRQQRQPRQSLQLEVLEERSLLNAGTGAASFAAAGGLLSNPPGGSGAAANAAVVRTNAAAASSTTGVTTSMPSVVAVRGGPASIVYEVTVDHALLRYDGAAWTRLGAQGTVLSASAAADQTAGGPSAHGAAVFVVTMDHALFEYKAGGWLMLGAQGTIQSVSGGWDSNGDADVYAITTGNGLNAWTVQGGWHASPMGGAGTIAAVSAGSAGTGYVVTTDGSLLGYSDSRGWFGFPGRGAGFASAIDAVSTGPGQAQIYVVRPDGTLSEQQDPGPSGIQPDVIGPPPVLGQWIVSISAGSDAGGQPEVFVSTQAGDIARYRASTGWQVLPARGKPVSFSATSSARVYAAVADGSVEYSDGAAGWMALPSI